MVMKTIGEMEGICRLEALPANGQKYRTIRVNNFVFLDSLAFMQAPLAELMEDLKNGSQVGGSRRGHLFPILDQLGLYDRNQPWLKQLLTRKGVYPYEHITSFEMLQQTKEIPTIDHFYSSLTNSNISPEDHSHACEVYKAFKCSDLLAFTELYCMTGEKSFIFIHPS